MAKQINGNGRHRTLDLRIAPDPGETQRDKFLRLGRTRVNRAVHSIHLIGNLSSPVYDYERDDIVQIRSALLTAVNKTMTMFEKPKRKKKIDDSFRFEARTMSQ